eukprot:gene37277-45261_t
MNLRICNGTLTALIFFWKSPTARENWYNLLTIGASNPSPATVSRAHHTSSNSEGDVEEFIHFDIGRKSLLDATMIGFEDQPRPTTDEVKMSTISIGIYS